MGPQQLSADFLRPLTPELSAPPKPKPKQNIGRFGDYLRDVRADGAKRRPEKPKESSAPDEGKGVGPKEAAHQKDEPLDKSSDHAAESSAKPAESQAPALPPVVQGDATQVFVEPSGSSAGETAPTSAGDVPSQVETPQPIRPAHTESQNAAQPSSESVNVIDTTSSQSGAASIAEEPAVVQVAGATEGRRSGRARTLSHAPQVHEATPPGPITRRDVPGTNRSQSPSGETAPDGPVPKVLPKQNRAEGVQPVVQRNSDRGVGKTDAPAADSIPVVDEAATLGRRNQLIGGAEDRGRASDPAPPLRKGPPVAAARLKTVSLRGGRGDGTAASVARFLVGSGGGGGGNAAAEGSGVTAPTTGSGAFQASKGAGSSAAASSSGMVSDLLAARLEGGETIDRVARAINASNGRGRQSVTMQLDPPHLGQLKLQIQMHPQGITLNIDTQTKDVARLIESRMADLHKALSTHGIEVQRANVVVRSPASGGAEPQSPGQGQAHDSGLGQGTSNDPGSQLADGGQRQMSGEGGLPQGHAIRGEMFSADDHVDPAPDVGTRLNARLSRGELSVDLVA